MDANLTFDVDDIKKIIKAFPATASRVMGRVGHQAAEFAKKKYLSEKGPNTLLYRGWKDKKGRHKILWSVQRGGRSVNISSYPLNLFERGRMLRSGKMEKGRYILSRRLRADVKSMQTQWLNWAVKKEMDKE